MKQTLELRRIFALENNVLKWINVHTVVHLAGDLKSCLLKIWPFSPGTTLKPRFYDPKQPQTTGKRKEKEGKRADEKKKRLLTLIIFILPR